MAKELNFFEEKDGRLSILLPFALKGVLDYKFSGERPGLGTFVRVPLAGRPVTGVVWESAGEENEVSFSKLKAIYEVLKVPSLTGEQRRFVEWVANYTISPPGNVLKMCMGSPDALKPLPTRMLYSKGRGAIDPARLTPARLQVLEVIGDRKLRTIKETAKKAGVSEAVVRGLIKLGLIKGVEQTRDQPYLSPDANKKGPALTEEQKKAVFDLKNVLEKGFQPLALEGVTGSGKTEVYFEAIAEILRQPDSQILVLLPEIALTNQWLERFEARFGAAPVEWHSDLGKAERRRAWRAVASGEVRVVVGARSALFLPFKKLKLVVVDEEHDSSFKQEEGVLYHARDMALVRAQMAECPIILSSATLSYETIANIERGRFNNVVLKHRYGGASLPDLSAIDMRTKAAPSGRWLSPDLVEALKATLGREEQAMLFLNRRGYAPLTLCRTCGERMECPNCTAWMVEHRLRRHLMCHHCGHTVPIPKFCPECGHEDSLTVCGPGVERLEEEVANLFPSAKRLVMTSDTMTS
ncbi:MAG: primosomal protein N', partial [Nitrospinaceae bacterium]